MHLACLVTAHHLQCPPTLPLPPLRGGRMHRLSCSPIQNLGQLAQVLCWFCLCTLVWSLSDCSVAQMHHSLASMH